MNAPMNDAAASSNDNKRHCSSPVTLASRTIRSRCVRRPGRRDSYGLSCPPLVAAMRQEGGERSKNRLRGTTGKPRAHAAAAQKKAQPEGLRLSSTKGGGFGGVRPRLRGGDAVQIILHTQAKCKRLLLLCVIHWTHLNNAFYINSLMDSRVRPSARPEPGCGCA